MSADKLAESNQRIASAASKEETPSKFLGLFVVGRLAARRGIDVELFESPSGGVTARVTLPASALQIDQSDPQTLPEIEIDIPEDLPELHEVVVPLDPPTFEPSGTNLAPSYRVPAPSVMNSPAQGVSLLVPPTLSDVPVRAVATLRRSLGPSTSTSAPAARHRCGRSGSPTESSEPVRCHRPAARRPPAPHRRGATDRWRRRRRRRGRLSTIAQDAVAVQQSLASFQSGTAQADQRSKTDEIVGTS